MDVVGCAATLSPRAHLYWPSPRTSIPRATSLLGSVKPYQGFSKPQAICCCCWHFPITRISPVPALAPHQHPPTPQDLKACVPVTWQEQLSTPGSPVLALAPHQHSTRHQPAGRADHIQRQLQHINPAMHAVIAVALIH